MLAARLLGRKRECKQRRQTRIGQLLGPVSLLMLAGSCLLRDGTLCLRITSRFRSEPACEVPPTERNCGADSLVPEARPQRGHSVNTASHVLTRSASQHEYHIGQVADIRLDL
jgi:hypothetical protein